MMPTTTFPTAASIAVLGVGTLCALREPQQAKRELYHPNSMQAMS